MHGEGLQRVKSRFNKHLGLSKMKEKLSREYIEDTPKGSFEYGTNDCALWAFKYVYSLNGLDLFTKYLGQYKTWSGGREALRKFGDKSLKDYLNNHFDEIKIWFAGRGDLVMYRGAVGICQGKLSFFLNKKNIISLNTLDCKDAWRVKEKCHK